MSEPAVLYCDHCGDVAIESENGLFQDGDGDACGSCGMPGHVDVTLGSSFVDDVIRWRVSQDDGVVCESSTCEDCHAERVREGDCA